MNFYLSAVDDFLRKSQDAPSIGMILCKSRDRDSGRCLAQDRVPIGVAEFITSLPPGLAKSLPTIEQMEAELTQVTVQTGALNLTGYSPTVSIGIGEDHSAEQRTGMDNVTEENDKL